MRKNISLKKKNKNVENVSRNPWISGITGEKYPFKGQDFAPSSTKALDRQFIYGNIIVDKGCWTGAFVSIKKDVHIEENSVIGAHSFVTKDTEKNSINFGIPSKKARGRS